MQGGLALVLGITLTYGHFDVTYSQAPGAAGYPYLLVPLFKNVYYAMGWTFVLTRCSCCWRRATRST